MLGSWWFIGWCLTLLWLPPIADKYGRRYLVWFAFVGILVSYAWILLTKSLVIMSILILI